LAADRVPRQLVRGKDELPGELVRRARIFPAQSIGQLDRPATRNEVPPVELAYVVDLALHRLDQRRRALGDAVLRPLAAPNPELPVAEVHVLHAQLQALAQAQARAVE